MLPFIVYYWPPLQLMDYNVGDTSFLAMLLLYLHVSLDFCRTCLSLPYIINTWKKYWHCYPKGTGTFSLLGPWFNFRIIASLFNIPWSVDNINLNRVLSTMVKHLCACSCHNRVTQRTESWHLNGQGPLLLASSVLSQSQSLSQKQKPSHQPAKQELVGCLSPLQQAVASRPASVNSPPPIEELASPMPEYIL